MKTNPIEQFLKRVAEVLDREDLPYMIIGGQAVLVHGRPRLTQDVDITLGVDTDHLDRMLSICRALNLRPVFSHPEEFARRTKVLPAEDEKTKLRADFIFSNTPYEQQAIRRAIKVQMEGYPVRFASAEDLVIHKIFAGRAIDLEDAQTVILRRSGLDRRYVRKWLRALNDVAEGGGNLLEVFDRLLKKAK